MSRTLRIVTLAMVVVLALGVVGCKKEVVPTVEPKVAPPAIQVAGILSVGVDLSTPPFAGVDQGKKAGIDIDVAAAMAEQLGLEVTYVDVSPSDAATALAQGQVDVVFSVPFTGTGLTQMTVAGTYLSDTAGFFITREGTASVEPSITIENVTVGKIAVQKESESYWLLRDMLGEDAVQAFPTLREAVEALSAGTVDMVAGDALIAAYIARDHPSVVFAGQLTAGVPLAAVVAADNSTLSDAVRASLDQLATDGVLDFIRTKWVGELPDFSVEESSGATVAP